MSLTLSHQAVSREALRNTRVSRKLQFWLTHLQNLESRWNKQLPIELLESSISQRTPMSAGRMAGAAASVLDATFLQASLTSLRDARKGAALGALKELESSARAQGSSSSQLPQVITLKTGSAAADILTSDLLLCTDITGCRIQELSKDGTLTLPEEPSEALLALVQLSEGLPLHCARVGQHHPHVLLLSR